MERKRLEECSGPWSGFWLQDLVRGNMRLRLVFKSSNINGGGNDPIGEFTITGIYQQDSERVIFTQVYKTHSVDYSGVWDGQMIYGRWTLDDAVFTESGEFEIWPDKEMDSFGFAAAETLGFAEGHA
jgi:hypothetical protein